MGRSPSCDKMGLRKGAWTPEEDRKLTTYIKRYGSWNWRELPKYAGLSRCGKSCRLRWMNYLRPDIKRGNYTKEEERIIMELHEFLGNRWSMIAAKLPGRTDNEIKNHWHTNLKKRLKQNSAASEAKLQLHEISQSEEDEKMELPPTVCQILESSPLSPRPSFIEFSTPNSESVVVGDPTRMEDDNVPPEILPEPQGDFWTEPNLAGNFYIQQDIPPTLFDPISLFPLSPISLYETFSLYETYSNDAIGC